MLIVLIPTVWLAIVAFVVAACWSAARGDEAMRMHSEDHSGRARVPTGVRWQQRHPVAAGTQHRDAPASVGARRTTRSRGSRCATSS